MNIQANYLNKTIKIQIPSKWDTSAMDSDLYIEALQRSAIHRLQESNQELNEISIKIEVFASKYGSFESFSTKLDNSFNQHQDWIEWSFLEKQKLALMIAIDKLKTILK